MNTQKLKPGRWYYVLAAIVLIAGTAASALLLQSMFKTINKSLAQVVAPGTREMTFSKPGKYTIYYEYKSVVNGRAYLPQEDLPSIDASVVSKATGAEIAVRPSSANITYNFGSRAGFAIFEFTITEPGVYDLSTRYADGTKGPEIVLAVGQGFMLNMTFAIVAIVLIFLFSLFVSAGIILAVFFLRQKARTRIQPVFYCGIQ